MKPFLLIAALLLCCNFVRGQLDGAAQPGEFPYVVHLRITSGFIWGKETFCGGAIIDSHWVLTAASCVNYWKTPKVEIVAGDFYGQSFRRVFTADKVLVHEEYANNNVFDVALLWLSNEITVHRNIRTTDIGGNPRLGETCTIFEWKSLWTDKKFLFSEQATVVGPMVNHQVRLRKDRRHGNVVTAPARNSGEKDIGGPIVCSDKEGREKVVAVLTEVHRGPTVTGAKFKVFSEWVRNKMGADVHRDEM